MSLYGLIQRLVSIERLTREYLDVTNAGERLQNSGPL